MDEDDESNQETQDTPDPNVYQPDQETDDVELDRRVRRVNERLRRMSIVPYPQFNEEFLCQDSITVEGGFSTGWAINYIDCGKQAERVGPPETTGACCFPDGSCDQETSEGCIAGGGAFQGVGTLCAHVDCSHTGACCFGTSCLIRTHPQCTASGGTYHGDGTTCSPNPCTGPPATARCCLPDHTCEDLTSTACTAAGGTFIAGTHCDDSACTCCSIIGAFGPGCSTGAVPDVCKTGPEQCDDPICQGETIPCDSLWLTVLEYCIHCPGSTRTLCCTSSWNPLTCELVQTDCDCGPMVCGSDGTTQEVMNQYVPCSSLMGAFDAPFFKNN